MVNKFIATLFYILIGIQIKAQYIKNDTFYIRNEYKRICLSTHSLTASGGKYYYNDKEIPKSQYLEMNRLEEFMCDSFLVMADAKYCKFFNKDSIVIEEGRWYHEFYTGLYKEYYDNGVLKVSGFYSDGKDGLEKGTKTGKWNYYDIKGKLKKTIDYSNKKTNK